METATYCLVFNTVNLKKIRSQLFAVNEAYRHIVAQDTNRDFHLVQEPSTYVFPCMSIWSSGIIFVLKQFENHLSAYSTLLC